MRAQLPSVMRYKTIYPFALCLSAALLILAGSQTNVSKATTQQQPKPTPTPGKSKLKLPKLTSHVVLISISGLRADYANTPETFQLRIPTIQTLRANGSYAVGVESVYPSQSLPAHASIATGVLPADHGITSDYAFDEQTASQASTPHLLAREIKGDTIWEAAKREGLTIAAIGYPLTAGAEINFNLTEVPAEKGSSMDSPEARKYSNPPELLNEILSALKPRSEASFTTSKIFADQTQDVFKAEAAAYLIEKQKPNLLLINFTAYDQVQNRFGLLSKESLSALELIDGLIKKIAMAIEESKLSDDTTFVIVSDHGASQIEREFRPNVLLAKKGFLTTDGQGTVKSWRAVAQSFGGSAAIFLKNPQDETAAAEIQNLFAALDKDSDNPLWQISPRRVAARMGADPHAVLYLEAAPRFAISARANGSSIAKTDERAAHGYLPSRAEMRAALIIQGKGIKANQRIEYARIIDVAPTIARLLGLEMKSARGRVLSEVITQ